MRARHVQINLKLVFMHTLQNDTPHGQPQKNLEYRGQDSTHGERDSD